jgi:hypothetical protein
MTPSPDAAGVAEWLKNEVRARRLPRRLDPGSQARIASILTTALVVPIKKTKVARASTPRRLRRRAIAGGTPASQVY